MRQGHKSSESCCAQVSHVTGHVYIWSYEHKAAWSILSGFNLLWRQFCISCYWDDLRITEYLSRSHNYVESVHSSSHKIPEFSSLNKQETYLSWIIVPEFYKKNRHWNLYIFIVSRFINLFCVIKVKKTIKSKFL